MRVFPRPGSARTVQLVIGPRQARRRGTRDEMIQADVMGPLSKARALAATEAPGFLYVPDLVSAPEERTLVAWFAASDGWNAVSFRGQTARRRALSFGARYLTQSRQLVPAPPLPPALVTPRDRMIEAACAGLGRPVALAGRQPGDFALCTALHYPPGAGIGWHADSPSYGPTVLCLSLGAPARLQLRPAADADVLLELDLAPRSLFVLTGEVRATWQHRVCPVRADRYSLTVRAPAPA